MRPWMMYDLTNLQESNEFLNDHTIMLKGHLPRKVPDHFRVAVEATLREFFNALMSGKDVEQSWKKPIYKIIARMDQPVPEFFKNPNWMEQLADG
ncbi:uncharacterized protein DEA37_0004025 [Paragonimus westermani]|uniref:Prospero domain-containing protein n=1 Tax=Paragonimus westermani TaxID=34504 RepID=A0A5J4NRC9_9TREM|nr:uncharacterized protein DEA37_0004025 [Paragonimus westermani]